MTTTPSLRAFLAASAHLPEHCTPTSPYLVKFSSAFHVCVPTSLAFLSTSLGIFSIVSWLFAQLPQIYKNYQIQSASGLSIYFLAEWLVGDLTNLLGALLTKQASWQAVIAGYYCTVDIALVGQYIWYTHLKPLRNARLSGHKSDIDGDGEGPGDVLEGISPPDGSSSSESIHTMNGKDDKKASHIPTKSRDTQRPPHEASSSFSFNEKGRPTSSHRTIKRLPNSPVATPSPKALLLVSMLCVVLTNASPLLLQDAASTEPIPTSESVGRIFSWCSTLLYLGSRLPQIYKNAVRRSTSGLSPTLFIAAFFGNLFYSISLLTNPLAWGSYPPHGLHGWADADGSDRKTWIALAAPFFLGAAGVLAMDAIVGVQFLVFGDGEKIVQVEDREGRSRWRRVRGWMRGWVPSPSPERRMEEVEDDRRPLMERRQSRGSGYGAAQSGMVAR
ncbi:hypothetical protein OEA41_009823 [Lepraria neglecta]|uniref:PQ-loop-domain-containing protein n=1 Tax=Lepraria neglecta TaxID=209136 RepID=A0AAD9YXV0_9LECA|nr:hypothetical protein OEA41_009823 [Lepraria neglecta]